MTEVSRIRYLTPREVGEIVGRSGDTIRRLVQYNQMRAVRMPPGQYYYILPSEVLRYAHEHEIPLPDSARQMLEEFRATEPKGIG